MPVPPDPILRAASRWLEHLAVSDVARTRTLFASNRTYADVTPTQYAAALTWLQESGLITPEGEVRVPPEPVSVMEAAVRDTLWLPDADLLISGITELPEDALRASEILGLGSEDALAVVRQAWGKVDTEARLRVGTAGEVALVGLLRAATDVPIRHIAATSDGYGYDIAVDTTHIEVKTTMRRGRLTIYLSRNEYETMRRDPGWLLALVRLDQNLQPTAVATLDRTWIEEVAPGDHHPRGRWESARLDVPASAVISGLPAVRRLTRTRRPGLLTGDPAWPS